MPRFPGVLNRFRRLLAPPGQPAAALGVPAAGDDLAAELAAVFPVLDAVGMEAAGIEEEAMTEAERLREHAVREAAAILEDARGRADAEHARAAAARHAETREVAAAAHEQARREAERIRQGLEGRLAVPVEKVVECVRRAGH